MAHFCAKINFKATWNVATTRPDPRTPGGRCLEIPVLSQMFDSIIRLFRCTPKQLHKHILDVQEHLVFLYVHFYALEMFLRQIKYEIIVEWRDSIKNVSCVHFLIELKFVLKRFV